jgi:hypothetical protein
VPARPPPDGVLKPELEEDPLARLDARLRRVGEWLPVVYTVALLLMTFGGERWLAPPPPEVAVAENLGDD